MIPVNDVVGIVVAFGSFVGLCVWLSFSRPHAELEDALAESENEVCRLREENKMLTQKVNKMQAFANLRNLDL